ncbi:Caffeoylshikimate esterase-like protein, partial [Drosera capensis]
SSERHHLYPFSLFTPFFLLCNKTHSSIDTKNQLISDRGGIGRRKHLLFRDQQIFMDSIDLKYEEEFVSGKGGLKLFTCRWLPAGDEPKALVFLLQGYAMDASISMKGTATRLARAGYGVYGIDYIGHGKSEGLHGYIPNFDDLVQDCADHYRTVCEREENKRKLRYMMGESMGGAVALFLHRMMPGFWDGAVLVAPMCKLADEMKPNPVVVTVLRKLCHVIPTWKLVPSQDIIEAAVKDPAAKEAVRSNPYWYTGRPRLKTADELLKATIFLEQRLHEV